MNCINVIQLILKMETEEQFLDTTKFLLDKTRDSKKILYKNLDDMINKNNKEAYKKIFYLLDMFCLDLTFGNCAVHLYHTKNFQTLTICKLNMYLDNINNLLEKINQTLLCELKFFSLRRFEQINKDILLLNKEINKLNYAYTTI